MPSERDFWEWEVDWADGVIEIDIPGGPPFEVSVPESTDFPTAKINAINDLIAAEISDSYGLLPDMWALSDMRADRFLAFYGQGSGALTRFTIDGTPALMEQLGFYDTPKQSTDTGSIRIVRADGSFQGAFAAPADRFQFILDDPHTIQSASRPYSGAPVVVPRGKYRRVHVRHQFVPGAMVFSERLSRPAMRAYAGLSDDEEHYTLEKLWAALSEGQAGPSVRCCPRVTSRYSKATKPDDADLLSDNVSVTPFPEDYTDDYLDVYFRGESYFEGPHELVTSSRTQTGMDSYHIDFEVFADANG